MVVGFSGGADSLALAAALGRVGPRVGLRPSLAHVDHSLRDISHQEQERTFRLADALGLPFLGLRVEKDVRLRHPGLGLEEAARRERYRVLAAAAEAARVGAAPGIVALAHHRGDQAETVLLHLLRGAGLAGAIGMAEVAERAVPWWEDATDAHPVRIVVWRPFLAESRSAVRAYAAGLGLAPIEDPSNADRRLRRNAVRHEALPVLEGIFPGAIEALARYGRLAADDESALAALTEAVLARVAVRDGGLRIATLAAESIALRRRVVRRWLGEQTGYQGVTADRTEAVLGLLNPVQGGRRVEIGEGWTVRERDGVLRVGRDRDDGTEEKGHGS